jgi:formylglycine-generating enzyme required for sulfatase activity
VELSPFYIDVNEVTKGEFLTWLVNRPMVIERYEDTQQLRAIRDRTSGILLLGFDRDWSWVEPVGVDQVALPPGTADEAAVGVSWDAARQYCANDGKRLPTDAEWEFAARGTTSRRYPWGDAVPTCNGVIFGRLDHLACDGMKKGPANVHASPQDWTPEGVHDLFGNASEWVEDAFVAPYLPDCGACKDPVVKREAAKGPDDRPDERVVRGASWMLYMFGQTSARARWRRDAVTMGLGFRCAVSAR